MVIDKKVISADAARKIAEGCEAYAKERGWHVIVWVLDDTLTPLYFYRIQGTPMFTVKPRLAKVEAAVRTGQPNEAYVRNAETRGQATGGIGISGSTDDRACAQAGIDTVFKK